MAEDRVKADEQAARTLSDDEARKLLAALKNDKSRRDAVQALIKKKEPDGHQDQVARASTPCWRTAMTASSRRRPKR